MNNERIWVYQAGRTLTDSEIDTLRQRLDRFVENWQAHGKPLKASYSIEHRLFVILRVDQNYNAASGCSIDDSVHLMQELEQLLGVSFFDRMRVAYLDGDRVENCSTEEFKALYADGRINDNTIVFNNMVTDGSQYERERQLPLRESWHKNMVS